MKLWFVSMECAGIAEAGGVKNVTFSLCKEFSQLGHQVTLFIPVFKCNSWDLIKNLNKNAAQADIQICGKNEKVSYYTAVCSSGNFNVVFVNHPGFEEKEAVYTYTAHEQSENPEFKKGEGHKDCLFLDVLFQKSVNQYLQLIRKTEYPDIVHCQDASTAVLPAFLQQSGYDKIKTVVTIHNAGPFYHHDFSSVGEAAWYTGLSADLLNHSMNKGHVEPFLIASNSKSFLTTVSEDYANELKDPANSLMTDGLAPIFAQRNIQITGITNGFDFERYNPSDIKVSKLPFAFTPEKGDFDGKFKTRQFFLESIAGEESSVPEGIKKTGFIKQSDNPEKNIYIAYHGRVTSQKGIAVLSDAIPPILNNFPDVRFVIAGQGEPSLESQLESLARRFPGKLVYLNGYNQSVVRMVTASCDFIVLPSFFEPCGLEDFIAQTFGTLPVAHKTGGLNKIVDKQTGFLYQNNDAASLAAKLSEVIMIKALKPVEILRMSKKAAVFVQKEYLWKNVVQKKYLKFFKEILRK